MAMMYSIHGQRVCNMCNATSSAHEAYETRIARVLQRGKGAPARETHTAGRRDGLRFSRL
jgi:hypothetical protein